VSRKANLENALGPEEVARIVGAGPQAAERSEKLRCIWEGLLDLYDPRQAVDWLQTALPALGDRSPIETMAEQAGLDRVLDFISRMTWGLTE
jgi:uncharacterized protein (DUF2384 family)